MIAPKKIIQHRLQWRLPLQLGKIQQSSLQSNQFGFTIIESLIAIVVVTILMTAIAPVIALSVATRLQARRVELGTQAARSYIDGVRSEAIAAPSHTVPLDEVDNDNNFDFQRATFANAAVPTGGSLSCPTTTTGYPYCSNTSTPSLYCIDLDGGGCSTNSFKDLVVQAFRSVTPTSNDAKRGYLLGVRVYRADAFSDNTPLIKSDSDNKRTQATFTGGLGSRKAPLVEMTTEIVVTNETTYKNLCERFGGCQ